MVCDLNGYRGAFTGKRDLHTGLALKWFTPVGMWVRRVKLGEMKKLDAGWDGD